MPVSFKYAMFEISGKPVLVDQKKIDEASKALKDGLKQVKELTDAVLKTGFALQTPEGMQPVVLGNVDSFCDWVASNLGVKSDGGDKFSLDTEIKKLPAPFSTVVAKLASIDIKLYTAALFYVPTGAPKKIYGELVIGFEVDLGGQGFPLTLKEIVIAVSNYDAAAPVAPK